MWHQRVNIFGGAYLFLGNRRLKTTAKGVWEQGYWSIMVLMPINISRFTAPQLLMNVFKVQWIFYSWRHTKPTSVRNRSGYIRTAVWCKCALRDSRGFAACDFSYKIFGRPSWTALGPHPYSCIWTSQVCNALAVLKRASPSWEYGLIHGSICWEPGDELGYACTKTAQTLKVEKEWERGYDWGSEYETTKGYMLLNIAWLHCGLMLRKT